MGVEYSPFAGVGIILDLEKLNKEGSVAHSCEHPERRGQRFCPTCGVEVKTYTTSDDSARFAVEEQFEGMSLPHDFICTQYDRNAYTWFLGFGSHVDRNEALGPFVLPDLARLDLLICEVLDKVAAEVGIVNRDDLDDLVVPESFGFHIAMPGY